jgi:hypothetical protein
MRKKVLLASMVTLAVMMAVSPAWAARPGGKGKGGPVVVAEGGVTDEDVRRSIEKAREWLTNEQSNGKWPEPGYWHSPEQAGHSELATMTLLYTGSHPTNSAVMVNALTNLMGHKLEYTYSVCCRTMAYAYALKGMQSAGPKRDQLKKALTEDAQWLVNNQLTTGDWGYSRLKPRPDFSNTQFAILALWEAAKAGVEIPDEVWRRTLNRYLAQQKADGSWTYGPEAEHSGASEGSMTAAGLATIYICTDMLNLASGCPCVGGKSGSGSRTDIDRKIELALKWLDENFTASQNPGEAEQAWRMYWLYAVERVGLAVGYKYFGSHNWFKEGAGVVISAQNGDGSWGPEAVGKPLVTTCFAALFLYKGRAPILFNKLQATPGGEQWAWNAHRRDIYNLTSYIEKNKEMQIQWQIVSLKGSVEELHDAPILFITAETAPKFTADEKKKLREFTDSGGTVLFEASCGAPAVRTWFTEFAKEVWPEWSVKPLGPDHGSFVDPYPLKTQRPEILGVDDGIRTCVFYAMDDISCPWQTKALASKEYIFKWGINLFTYATDHSPLRAKLASRDSEKGDKYTSATVKAGAKATVTVARLKTDSDWITNRNYKGLEDIAAEVSKKAGLTVKFEQDGVDPSALGGKEAAYLVGSKELKMSADQQTALKDYLAKGGFLWAEAADGAQAFDESFRTLAKTMGWELKVVDKTEPLMTGNFPKALGYNLTTGVQFRRALKISRLGRPYAEFMGIYQGGRMVGVYSPLDIGFAATPYEAYACRGYKSEDAVGVATNILLCISDR